MDNDLLLQTLQRIESKVDNSIVNHGERIAKIETQVAEVKADQEKQDTRQWIHSTIVFCGAMLSHLGVNKLFPGWRI